MISSVSAQVITKRCLNNSHIQSTMNWTECHGSSCEDNSWVQPAVNCTFGCDTTIHECRNAEIIEYGGFFVGIIIILILAGITLKLFNKW